MQNAIPVMLEEIIQAIENTVKSIVYYFAKQRKIEILEEQREEYYSNYQYHLTIRFSIYYRVDDYGPEVERSVVEAVNNLVEQSARLLNFKIIEKDHTGISVKYGWEKFLSIINMSWLNPSCGEIVIEVLVNHNDLDPDFKSVFH